VGTVVEVAPLVLIIGVMIGIAGVGVIGIVKSIGSVIRGIRKL
jgi:hypothetical protein